MDRRLFFGRPKDRRVVCGEAHDVAQPGTVERVALDVVGRGFVVVAKRCGVVVQRVSVVARHRVVLAQAFTVAEQTTFVVAQLVRVLAQAPSVVAQRQFVPPQTFFVTTRLSDKMARNSLSSRRLRYSSGRGWKVAKTHAEEASVVFL